MPRLRYSIAMPQDTAASLDVAARDEQSFSILPGDLGRGLLLVCDHAGNAFPDGYGTLGLATSELQRHIAYDIGAAEVTRRLSEGLGVPALRTKFSRLLIDPNRGEDDPTLIMQLSDGAVVPGNRRIDATEREHRIEHYYRPYHDAIHGVIQRALGKDISPILLSVHSFTDRWKSTARPWHITVLWDRDPRMPKALLRELRTEPTLVVDENVPYSGRLKGDCMNRHGTNNGLPHALIEIRQDLIQGAAGQAEWAERLRAIMERLLGDIELMSACRDIGPFITGTAPQA